MNENLLKLKKNLYQRYPLETTYLKGNIGYFKSPDWNDVTLKIIKHFEPGMRNQLFCNSEHMIFKAETADS